VPQQEDLDGPAAAFTHLYTQLVSVALQRAQAQQWRRFLADGGLDQALARDAAAAEAAERLALVYFGPPDVGDLPLVVFEPVL
jgi:hypothetical protein